MCIMSDGIVNKDDVLGEGGDSKEQTKGHKVHKQDSEDGINLNYFVKHCSFLSGTLPSISKRLLVAIGKSISF